MEATKVPFKSNFIEGLASDLAIDKWEKNNGDFIGSHQPQYLSSFPRSGNGWVRLVLAATLLELKGIDCDSVELTRETTDTGVGYICFKTDAAVYSLEDVFPDMYLSDFRSNKEKMAKDIRGLELQHKVIKTHHIVDISNRKTVFLFRDPHRCLTSASLLLNKEPIERNPVEINETITYLAKYYDKMLESYLSQKSNAPDNCLLIDNAALYGDLAVAKIKITLDFLGIEAEESTVEKVIDKYPLRSAYNKQFEQHVTEETKMAVENLMMDKYRQAIAAAS